MSDEINKYTKSANKNPIIKEIEPVIKKLKDNGIYTIARIVSFKDTIYNNIKFGNEDASKDEIMNAAKWQEFMTYSQ